MCDCTVLDTSIIVIKQVKRRELWVYVLDLEDEPPNFVDEAHEDTPPLKFTLTKVS